MSVRPEDYPQVQLELLIPGVPAPQGSFRPVVSKSTGKAMLKSNEGGGYLRYRADIRSAMQRRLADIPPWTGPINAYLGFVFPRPEGHWLPANSRREKPVLRPGAPMYVSNKPDLDKLVRAVLDALTGIAYVDDSQVVSLQTTKRWDASHDSSGLTSLRLWRMGE